MKVNQKKLCERKSFSVAQEKRISYCFKRIFLLAQVQIRVGLQFFLLLVPAGLSMLVKMAT